MAVSPAICAALTTIRIEVVMASATPVRWMKNTVKISAVI